MHQSQENPLLEVPASPSEEISILDLALVLARRRKLLLGLPPAAGALALAASFLITPTFVASTRIMLPQQQQSSAAALLGSLGGFAGAAAGAAIKNPADQWIGLLKSRTVQDALISRYKLRERYAVEFQFLARNKLSNKTTINAGKDGLISIEVADHDPKIAAQMADTYVDELRKLSTVLAVTEAAQRRVFFETQLKDTKDNLIKAETTLRRSGVGESLLKTRPEVAAAGVAQLKAQVTAAEVRVSVMQGQMTPNNPEMQLAQSQLSSLRAQLARVERDDSNATGGSDAEYISRYRDFKYYETLFELMARQYELARSDEAKEGALIQVVDHAQIPELKSSPKRGMIALIAFAGTLTLTILYIFLAESATKTTREDPVHSKKLRQLKNLLRGRPKDSDVQHHR